MENDAPIVLKSSLVDRLLSTTAAVEENILCLCPEHDRMKVRALGALLLVNGLWQANIFYRVGEHLFGMNGSFEPVILAHSLAIAALVGLIDHACVMRGHWHREGLAQLKQAGISIESSFGPRIHAGFLYGTRVVLALGMSQLMGIGVALLIYGNDIEARLHNQNLQINARLIADATNLVDQQAAAAKTALDEMNARVKGLSANVASLRNKNIDPLASDPQVMQAQQEVAQLQTRKDAADAAVVHDEQYAAEELAGAQGNGHSGKPGIGPRRRAATEQLVNARTHAADADRNFSAAKDRLDALRQKLSASADGLKQQSQDALPGYEQTLNVEEAKAATLKGELNQLVTGRETAISEAVQKSPGYVPEERGLLVQLATLEALTKENPRIGVIVWLLDLVAVGFELAAMLGASAYAPTCYASLLTKRQYLHDLAVADEIGEALEASADKQTRSKEAKQEGLKRQSAFQPENEPTSPQRRPRGRPRKNAFVVTPVGPPTQA